MVMSTGRLNLKDCNIQRNGSSLSFSFLGTVNIAYPQACLSDTSRSQSPRYSSCTKKRIGCVTKDSFSRSSCLGALAFSVFFFFKL